jgi:DNA polymerase-3 subunit epsilon
VQKLRNHNINDTFDLVILIQDFASSNLKARGIPMTSFFRQIFGKTNKAEQIVKRNKAVIANPSTTGLGHEFEQLMQQTFRFIAIDVETANRNAHSICQIGLAMAPTNGSIRTAGFLVNPEERFEAFNTQLHGISAKTVTRAHSFEAIMQILRPFLERHTLIQHSNFDKRAFDAACQINEMPPVQSNWLDSVIIARTAWPELKGNGGHGLASLKTHLSLEFDHHDAEEDARAAAEIVLRAETRSGEQFLALAKTAKQKSQRSSVEVNKKGPLYGHVACFSGQLSLNRTDATKLAASAGILVKVSMSQKVTMAIVGEQDLTNPGGRSKKHQRAKELLIAGADIRIIGEREFLALVRKVNG